MLHALPDLLDALEHRLMRGEDPLGLLASIRWSELVGWPKNLAEAQSLQQRVGSLQTLVNGLQAPLRATLMGLAEGAAYGRDGHPQGGPVLVPQIHGRV